VPSNLPTEVDAAQVREVRLQFAPDPRTVVLGHFGTFAPAVADLLRGLLPPLLLAETNRTGLLLGRRAAHFVEDLLREYPALAGRLAVRENLPADRVAVHLAACDLLLQPYPDGASTRRTSLMSGLALGLPVLTTEGVLTEPLWRASGAVLLAPLEPKEMCAAAERLLASAELRSQLGSRAAELYRQSFSLERVIAALRSA
jgi:glycosyltransferase involved in cell wall biosynthesis